MKMYYGDTPIKSLKIKHYEVSTHDATIKSSDLQTGITAYAKGKKVTGTGKSFEFASYGDWTTNLPFIIPTTINVVQVGSLNYFVKTEHSETDCSVFQSFIKFQHIPQGISPFHG